MTTSVDNQIRPVETIDALFEQLFDVIYAITGASATIDVLSKMLDRTDVGKGILCPEIAITAVARTVYDSGDKAFDLISAIRDRVEGGLK